MKPIALLFTLASLTAGCASAQIPDRAAARQDPKVFESAPATFAPDIFGERQKPGADGVLRVLTVEERVGQERTNELVRVPLFFHAGECPDPAAIQIVAKGAGTPIPFQADDVRRDAGGQVARMHAYFVVSLKPWERKQFNLIEGKNPGAAAQPLPITETADKVILAGEDLKVTFHTKGKLQGAISAIETSVGKVALPDGNFAPETTLIRQDAKLATVRENKIDYLAAPEDTMVKALNWSSGPLFSKLVLKLAPKAAPTDIAEYVYRVPKFGNELTQTELFYPEEPNTTETVGAKGNAMLTGKLVLGDALANQAIVSVPAGLRRELRSVFGYRNKAVVNARSGISLFAIPYTQSNGDVGQAEDGRVFFNGSPDFQTRDGSNSGPLRAFWGQNRYIFSKATEVEDLWRVSCRGFQPLTAVADEPWASPDDLMAFAKDVNKEFWNIKNWGRSFEANLVMNYLSGKDITKDVEVKDVAAAETKPDIRSYIPTQEAIDKAWKSAQGAGNLDPYGITYSSSAVAPFSALVAPSRKLDNMAYSLGQASRLVNDKPTPQGWPNIRTFANTANMKIGTYLCAVWGGQKTGDPELVQWGRDAATAQNLLATYGHGQRPYDMSVGGSGPSDVLYISITDYWLRTIELLCNEDLSIHPSVYGRYFDMVDVNSDLYQRKFAFNKETKTYAATSEPTWWRATFFRGQQHDHRWEGYGCDTFLGLLRNPADKGKIGITEACYYMQRQVGRPQSWNNLMTNVFFPAIMTTKGLENYQPPTRPALPAGLHVTTAGDKNTVTWTAVPGAVGYRLYRSSSMGGPWSWVNTPYLKMDKLKAPTAEERAAAEAAAATDDQAKAAAQGIDIKKLKRADKTPVWSKLPEVVIPSIPDTLIKTTTFTDPDGKAGDVYFVTAQDKSGRESRWFPGEPANPASK